MYTFYLVISFLFEQSPIAIDLIFTYMETNLLEMVWKIIVRSKDLVDDIINRDYSWLDHRIFNTISVADVIILIVALLAVRDIIYFCFKLSSNFFKNIVRTVMSFLSIQFLVTSRHIALRCYATLLFFYELPAILDFRERIMRKTNQFLNRD